MTSAYEKLGSEVGALVAAQQLGRRAVDVKREERYCEVAARRLKAAGHDGAAKAA
ncbi:hypothetical protein [Corallococcus soli]|uniref:hypothetical protein n=1 Tax=Corallococcus soli TaxID=2710757 RepID=UPI001D058859|nr:hypothetical protein [Corallococcus soli]